MGKKKIISIIVSVVFVIIGYFGAQFAIKAINNMPKEYSNHGMTITMTNGFKEKEVLSYTYYLERKDSIMVALKEEKPYSTMTLTQYTNAVLTQNMLTGTTIENRNTYQYFEYEKDVNGKEFYYLATTHNDANHFWLIQFACETKNKDDFKDKFLTWSDSISFYND